MFDQNEYNKKYYSLNKERIKSQNREYYRNNIEKCKLAKQKYYCKNKEYFYLKNRHTKGMRKYVNNFLLT